ncbi:MAG: OsmC-related (seleno)protein [Candidatus Bathyarchaeia archaeon]
METCCVIDYEKLGKHVDDAREKMTDPKENSVVTLKVDARLIENFLKQATTGSGFTLTSDEQVYFGGTAKGPTPMETFLAALGFCQMTIYATYASTLGVKLDGLEISLRGDLDLRGLLGLSDARPGFTQIRVETRIVTEENEEKVKRLVDTMKLRCPATNNLRQPTPLFSTLIVNGKTMEENKPYA